MDFLPASLQELLQNQPTWVYALILIIPFCMALSFREFMCWFWKANKVVNRLDRIDRSLQELNRVLSQNSAAAEQAKNSPRAVKTANARNTEEVSRGPTSTGDEDFKLE